MWTICHGIVVIFELFMIAVLIVALIGAVVHGNTPKWFQKIFDLFFGIEDGDA